MIYQFWPNGAKSQGNGMLSDDFVKLDEISGEYFGLSVTAARRKATLQTLPIPAIRLSNTRRGPLLVRRTDLEAYVANKVAAATKLHQQMSTVRSSNRG